ncbi:CAP domain-containing protein [Virgibacillus oceani]
MMKKLSIITALFTILLGGIFASTVSASASEQGQQNSYKTYYSINGGQKDLSGNELCENFITQYQQPQWQNDEENQHQGEENQQQDAAPAEQTATEEKEESAESAASELSQFEQEVVDLTNAERSKHGLQALEADVELSKVAREKSRDMATSNYFDHNSPNYGSPFDMMQQFGVSYQTAGENIAKGQQSPQDVVDAWMNSEGHRANILNGDFTHIGVGFVEQGSHWTQMFIGK